MIPILSIVWQLLKNACNEFVWVVIFVLSNEKLADCSWHIEQLVLALEVSGNMINTGAFKVVWVDSFKKIV